jgi:hypothetical protein
LPLLLTRWGQFNLSAYYFLPFAFTSTNFLPQVQFPGFWLMVSHLQLGPQSQAYFPTLMKGFALDATVIFPFSTFVTFVLTMSLPHEHWPAFLDIVSHGQPSPQAQTYSSSPTFAFMMGESANAKAAKARVQTAIRIRIFFIHLHLLSVSIISKHCNFWVQIGPISVSPKLSLFSNKPKSFTLLTPIRSGCEWGEFSIL